MRGDVGCTPGRRIGAARHPGIFNSSKGQSDGIDGGVSYDYPQNFMKDANNSIDNFGS